MLTNIQSRIGYLLYKKPQITEHFHLTQTTYKYIIIYKLYHNQLRFRKKIFTNVDTVEIKAKYCKTCIFCEIQIFAI